MILYHAADLIWATKIKGTADAIGVPARPVRTLEMLAARLADSPVRALIVDLEAPETAIELLTAVRNRDKAADGGSIRTLAFGLHVAADRFAQARVAGATTLMARGAFSARMSSVLRDLELGSNIPDAAED
jgi:hypothetical protein